MVLRLQDYGYDVKSSTDYRRRAIFSAIEDHGMNDVIARMEKLGKYNAVISEDLVWLIEDNLVEDDAKGCESVEGERELDRELELEMELLRTMDIRLRDYGYSTTKTQSHRIEALEKAAKEEGMDLVCARLKHLGQYHPVMLDDLGLLIGKDENPLFAPKKEDKEHCDYTADWQKRKIKLIHEMDMLEDNVGRCLQPVDGASVKQLMESECAIVETKIAQINKLSNYLRGKRLEDVMDDKITVDDLRAKRLELRELCEPVLVHFMRYRLLRAFSITEKTSSG